MNHRLVNFEESRWCSCVICAFVFVIIWARWGLIVMLVTLVLFFLANHRALVATLAEFGEVSIRSVVITPARMELRFNITHAIATLLVLIGLDFAF